MTNFSKAVEAAADNVVWAEKALLATMQREYPVGKRVVVTHSRGRFYGTITGYDPRGRRISIRNERSAKGSHRWYREVELTQASGEVK
jgi:dihydropteroate synthase